MKLLMPRVIKQNSKINSLLAKYDMAHLKKKVSELDIRFLTLTNRNGNMTSIRISKIGWKEGNTSIFLILSHNG